MPYLLDTDVAIHLRDGDPHVRALLLTLDELPALSAITRVELEGGVHAKPALAAKRRQALDVLLRNFEVIDFTDELATRYGEIVARAGFSRREVVHRVIAATALSHGLTLVTLNGRDFRDVPELDLRVDQTGRLSALIRRPCGGGAQIRPPRPSRRSARATASMGPCRRRGDERETRAQRRSP